MFKTLNSTAAGQIDQSMTNLSLIELDWRFKVKNLFPYFQFDHLDDFSKFKKTNLILNLIDYFFMILMDQ